MLARLLKYYSVGTMGLGVKFGMLIVLREWFGLHYLIATAGAVESVLLHNFCWNSSWTWRDRKDGLQWRDIALRLLRLHLTTGAVAMAVNLGFMRLLVGGLGMHYVAANVVATMLAGLMNFVLGHWVVYRRANFQARNESSTARITP